MKDCTSVLRLRIILLFWAAKILLFCDIIKRICDKVLYNIAKTFDCIGNGCVANRRYMYGNFLIMGRLSSFFVFSLSYEVILLIFAAI